MFLYRRPKSHEPPLNEENLFDVLSSSRRRHVLCVLHRLGALELVTITEEVAAMEIGSTVDEVDPNEQKRVYISCYQTHVPRLVETGLVEFSRETGLVEPTSQFRDVERYLGWRSNTVPDRVLLLVGIAAATFYGGVLFNAPLLRAVSLDAAGAVVVTVIAIVIGYVLYQFRHG